VDIERERWHIGVQKFTGEECGVGLGKLCLSVRLVAEYLKEKWGDVEIEHLL